MEEQLSYNNSLCSGWSIKRIIHPILCRYEQCFYSQIATNECWKLDCMNTNRKYQQSKDLHNDFLLGEAFYTSLKLTPTFRSNKLISISEGHNFQALQKQPLFFTLHGTAQSYLNTRGLCPISNTTPLKALLIP